MKLILLLVFLLSFGNFVFPFLKTERVNKDQSHPNEEFSADLLRLNSEKLLTGYVDSLYQTIITEDADSSVYPGLLTKVVRARFLHGEVKYSLFDNFLATAAAKITGKSLDEIWIPDLILRGSQALCGQQSVVMMSILMDKGYTVRPIYFNDNYLGHFNLEVYYNNDWHFFDPDLEPDRQVLEDADNPSLVDFVADSNLLFRAYKNSGLSEASLYSLFKAYDFGPVNLLIPKRIYYFQLMTFYTSKFLWIGVALVFWYFYVYPKRKGGQREEEVSTVASAAKARPAVKKREVSFPEMNIRESEKRTPNIYK